LKPSQKKPRYTPWIKQVKNGKWRVRVPIPGEADYVLDCHSLEQAKHYRDEAFASLPPLIDNSIFATAEAKYATPRPPKVTRVPVAPPLDSGKAPGLIPAPAPEPPPREEPPRRKTNATLAPSGFPSGFLRRGEDLHADTTGRAARYKKQQEGEYGDEDKDENEETIIREGDELFICGGGFDVVAHLQSESKHFFHLVEFNDVWGNKVKLKLPFSCSAKKILTTLVNSGLKMPYGLKRGSDDYLRELLIYFINNREVTRRITTVSRRWHARCYVTLRGAIGPTSAGEELVLADSVGDTQTYCGTLAGWQSTIGAACVGNRILTVSVSVAFSAFVLELLNAECIGFMLFCDSSMGKGSTVSAACSVAGTKLSDCNGTPYNIETHATKNSDTLIVFDELGEAENPAEFSRNIYILGNGRGKGRYQKRKTEWRVPWMLTGETSMSDFRLEAKMKPLTRGEAVRLIEIFADVGKGFGTFDTIHQQKDSQHFADALQAWATQNQGVAAEAFLTRVTADPPYAIKKLNETREAFIAAEKTRHNLRSAPHDLIRALDHFAVVAASGELATEYGTVPWQAGDATRAVSATFGVWYTTYYHEAGNSKSDTAQDVAHDTIEWIIQNQEHIPQRTKRNHTEYDIPVDIFRDLPDYKDALEALREMGMLVFNKGGLTLRRRDPSEPKGYCDVYCVRLPNSGNNRNSGNTVQ
jgi:hypothetical protein